MQMLLYFACKSNVINHFAFSNSFDRVCIINIEYEFTLHTLLIFKLTLLGTLLDKYTLKIVNKYK